MSAAFETLRFSASMISVLIRSPGWGGFFIGILAFLVIIDQVDIGSGVCFGVVLEHEPPVSSHG